MKWLAWEAAGSLERLTRRVLREITALARCRAQGRALTAAAPGVTAAAIIAATAALVTVTSALSSKRATITSRARARLSQPALVGDSVFVELASDGALDARHGSSEVLPS